MVGLCKMELPGSCQFSASSFLALDTCLQGYGLTRDLRLKHCPFFADYLNASQLSAQLFLVEVVHTYTASALAAFTVASSIGGALIPLSTFPLYDSIGHGWGNTTIALVNLLLILIPLTMYTVSRRLGDDQTLAVYLDSSDHTHGCVIGTIPTLSGQ